MINVNRPIINLGFNLLGTSIAIAGLDTSAAVAATVCRTQSAVGQQIQRLEQLVGKELFARHRRNKLPTEHGIQPSGCARKILRFNDEACSSLVFNNLQGVLAIGASDEPADTVLPFLFSHISSVYPKLILDVKVKHSVYIVKILRLQEADLVVITNRPSDFECPNLRASPIHWYYATEYILQKGEPVPLVPLDDPGPFHDIVLTTLDTVQTPWRLAYAASTLPATRAAVKAGLSVTVRPAEMMSPNLRVLGVADGLPSLPDTEYLLYSDPATQNELAQVIFRLTQTYQNPWQYNQFTPGGGDDSLIIEDDFEQSVTKKRLKM